MVLNIFMSAYPVKLKEEPPLFLPALHQFRSYSLKSESEYIQNSWRKCLHSVDTLKIPHQAIRVFDGQGELNHIIYTDFLQDDDDDDDGEGECQNGNPDNDIVIDSNDHLEIIKQKENVGVFNMGI